MAYGNQSVFYAVLVCIAALLTLWEAASTSTVVRRVIVRIGIRRRGHPPHIYRFHADRWHSLRVYALAGQIQSQQIDSIPMQFNNQPTILVMRSNVEGIRYYKQSATAEYAPRILRPFEVTEDTVWRINEPPIVVIENRTRRQAEIDIFWATRCEGSGGGGGDIDI